MKHEQAGMPVLLKMERKTNKELAYLHELFIATDWGERFAELVDEHVTLPKEGHLLYVAAGTGGHAIALQERATGQLKFLCVDENEECLELARVKAIALRDAAEFRQETVDDLTLPDDKFTVVIGDASLVETSRAPEMLKEIVRVAAPGGKVAFIVPTFSSFGEFFSIYWEALHNLGLMDHEADVESLISKLPSVSAVEGMGEQAGLEEIESWTRIEEFDYESGEQFLNAPLIADFLLDNWLKKIPAAARGDVVAEIERLINEERHEAEFALSVKATLVVGRKALNH